MARAYPRRLANQECGRVAHSRIRLCAIAYGGGSQNPMSACGSSPPAPANRCQH